MKLGRTGNIAQIIDRPAYEFEIIAFTGEIVDSRTGDENPFYGISRSQVLTLIKAMEPGDSITVNATSQ